MTAGLSIALPVYSLAGAESGARSFLVLSSTYVLPPCPTLLIRAKLVYDSASASSHSVRVLHKVHSLYIIYDAQHMTEAVLGAAGRANHGDINPAAKQLSPEVNHGPGLGGA